MADTFPIVLTMCLSALAMAVIVTVRYLAVSGGFALLTRLRHPRLYQGQASQISREIRWSLISALVYGLPAGLIAWGWQNHGWTRIYDQWDAYPVWWLPVSALAYLLAHDAWFYWTHRAMHHPALFGTMHAVHHASRPPTAWAAMAFHPYEAVTGAVVVPALIFLIPIHVAMLGVVLAVMTFMGVTNHMGWEIFPRAIVHRTAGKILITATHHQLHHQRYRCNYGLYFRFWDRLCGTDKGLGKLP